MNEMSPIRIGHSACPHDCPSCCALDVELTAEGGVGRVRGSAENDYTAGVICAKVARYAERLSHPERLTKALRRTGGKGEGTFQEISAEDALDEIAEAFRRAEARHGPETVWPYFYAGTMGLVQRDGINRLRHVKGYSGQYDTICTNMAWTGYVAGTGKLAGPDPREIAKSDLVVIWGTNAVATQINVMTHATAARKQRGARIVVVDVYDNATMRQADLALRLRPGTDAALACAVMHILFRDGHADWEYLSRYADRPQDFARHLLDRTPEWAAAITGLSVHEIETLARWIGETPKTFLRLGYGFTRSRNGAVAMHAAASIATVTGAWRHEGGGAFHNNGAIYHLDTSMISGLDKRDPSVRFLDQSRIGAVLTGEVLDLKGGPPVTAMLVQNTNPANVAPEQEKVARGLAREDLFLAVHEQFMTETAEMADIVLPATMFLEHDDVYKGGGHQHILFGGKLVEPPEGCLTNHAVICGLAARLGAEHPGFAMSEREHIDHLLAASGWGDLERLERERWIDCQPPFEEAHYLDGFAWPDGKFRFAPAWSDFVGPNRPPDAAAIGPHQELPEFPDHWAAIEAADETYPFRLVTAPARSFLNSTFSETPTGQQKEGRPEVMVHPEDAAALSLSSGDLACLESRRGATKLHVRVTDVVGRGTLVAEGIWPNRAHVGGRGINALTGADSVAPHGGAAFHDNAVRISRVVLA
ncbi:molybdopterin oxidoreductase family protein [Afifella sp. IM 167]|uniref:molybdopterin oxidoreductase family protein n=1 Tax=Afifella sp. IM 167 TaxID=2033586 RepID=UPI001CCA2D88|nr:molybdopterin oxidoreductase family protein [Afifella sp. IM 167]MBZ8134556.1 dehydrogenase [Afifella sp. IM 167]